MHIPLEYIKKQNPVLVSVAFVCICTILFFVYTFLAEEYVKYVDGPEMNVPTILNVPVVETNTKNKSDELLKPETSFKQLIKGEIVSISNDSTYMRVHIAERGIYSFGISSSTRITRLNTSIELSSIEPFAEVSIEAVKLMNSEMYDYEAQSIVVHDDSELTKEERVNKMLENAKFMNQQ